MTSGSIHATLIEKERSFVKIWGQLDKNMANCIHDHILQRKDDFDNGVDVLTPEIITPGLICCAQFEDTKYYRARIISIAALQQGNVEVIFIDYGNRCNVELSHIRTINSLPNYISSHPPLAKEFILAKVEYRNDDVDDSIVDEIQYCDFIYQSIGNIGTLTLIEMFNANGQSMADTFIERELLCEISISQQKLKLEGKNNELIAQRATLESTLYDRLSLSDDSEHMVYVNYVDDGPFLFCVQLESRDAELKSMMYELNNMALIPFDEPPLVGSRCLAVNAEDDLICRGTILQSIDDTFEIMVPPSYADLGKNARDVFNKGYHFGLIKLDVKTKTSSGVAFNTTGTSNQENNEVFGTLETKYNVKECGLTFTEKWNTDNTLGTEVTLQDQLLKGLKIGGEFNFSPASGNKMGKLKTAYGNDMVYVNADGDFTKDGPILNGALVLGYQGWLAGYNAGYDINNSKLTKNNFALGFAAGDFILHSNVNIASGQEFAGSMYQRISPRLESGIQIAWATGGNNTRFGIAAKYNLDQGATLRAKINNVSQIGLGYQQQLRDGVSLSLSTLIDGKNFASGGHKVGVALELDA